MVRHARPLSARAGLGVALAALLAAVGGGCSWFAVEPPPEPTPMRPVWEPASIANHLELFNSAETAGRATGTQGYARAAAYVAARMREANLQPVYASGFRVLYYTGLNQPRAGFFVTTQPDSLYYVAGADYLPGALSDSGRVAIRDLVVIPDPATLGVPAGTSVLISSARATRAYLRELQAMGVRAVFVVGALRPGLAARPLPGMLQLDLAPAAAADLLQIPPESVPLLFASGEPYPRRLERPVVVQVQGGAQPLAGAINTMAYLPGKNPMVSDELVIVCAHLDALGQPGGVPLVDFDELGVGAAALLELARLYGRFSLHARLPERTILFAVWSGGQVDHAGLRAYLEQPSWDREAMRSVLYLGLDADEEAEVRTILDDYGLPLTALPVPAVEGYEPGRIFSPPSRRAPRGGALQQPPLQLSRRLRVAATAAQTLAEAAHPLLLAEVMTEGPLRPVPADSIPAPPTARSDN